MAICLLNAGTDTAKIKAVAARMKAAIPDLVETSSIDEILKKASARPRDPVHVLVVAPHASKTYFDELLALATRHRDRLFFILIGEELSASDYKALVRTGGADWVSDVADPREILEIVARMRRPPAPSGGAPRRPVAVSFVPSSGGVGNATLCVETAAYLKTGKATRGRHVCIVDLDFQSSHLCDYLDIEPRLRIEEISSNPDRLDAQLFEIFISRHVSGVHVFAAPRSKFDLCDLNVVALDRLFDMMAVQYDLILIDLPATWFAWTPQIIAASDGVVVTGANTIPGLRQAAETLAEVRRAARPTAQIAIAVNRCERGLFGRVVRRQHVDSVLAGEKLFFVGDDAAALQSINTGVPMVLAKASRPMTRDIAHIATFCAGLEAAVT
jgi:pilus assembly protein CpaE